MSDVRAADVVRSLLVRVEDVAQGTAARLLLRAGRPARVHAFSGLASAGTARLGGRVLVGAAGHGSGGSRSGGDRSGGWSSTVQMLRANLAPFLTVEVPGARVRVEIGGRSVVAVADREGYAEATLDDVHLPPGPHRALLTPVAPAGDAVTGTVHVPDPAADVAVVSDIDDTIVDSGVAHGLLAVLRIVLLSDPSERVPLDGAASLYQALARGSGAGPERPFFYLSTSPWNLVGFLQDFLQRHGFPPGPLALTDWGPGSAGLFRVGTREHKLGVLRGLAADLPGVRFVLLGDSGQADPEIYTAFALEHPGRVAAVYIRRAGLTGPARQQRLDDCARRLHEVDVPFVVAGDSATMLTHARAAGLASDPAAPQGAGGA
jgi:phosphatidate phosphatase APP1